MYTTENKNDNNGSSCPQIYSTIMKSHAIVRLLTSSRAKTRYLQNCEKQFPTLLRSGIRLIFAIHNFGDIVSLLSKIHVYV